VTPLFLSTIVLPAPITRLIFSGLPPAIKTVVVFIIMRSIDSCPRKPSCFHVSPKCFILGPLGTDLNRPRQTATVMLKVFVRWIEATRDHVAPSCVNAFLFSRSCMRCVPMGSPRPLRADIHNLDFCRALSFFPFTNLIFPSHEHWQR